MNISLCISSVSLLAVSSMTALAQNTALTPLQGSLDSILQLVSTSTVIIVGAAFLFFFYGLAVYILKGDGEEKDRGKRIMVWGTVAIFVLTTIWGLVAFIRNVVGVDAGQDNPIQVPGVDFG